MSSPCSRQPGLIFPTGWSPWSPKAIKRWTAPCQRLAGRDVFTAELENALRSGQIDLAVHSLKDLPVENAPGLCIGAISARADARDVFISANYQSLAHAARWRAGGHLQPAPLSPAPGGPPGPGPSCRCAETWIPACAKRCRAITTRSSWPPPGWNGSSWAQYVTEYLPFEVMLPAPGQGALAVQCRAEDGELLQLLRPIAPPGYGSAR